MRRALKHLALPALGAISAVLASVPAGAAAWEFNPTVEAGYLYDDNYRLGLPGTEIDVQGGMMDAALEMRTLTPQGEFSFTPRVRATYFPDESELDSVDYFGALDWQRRGQRLQTRVRGDFSLQDVVNSEQPDAEIGAGGELGETDFGDAGLAFVSNRRMRFAVRPTMNFELSARRQLLFGAGYTDVSFDREIPGQVGYNTVDVSGGLLTRVNERSSFTVRLRGDRYDIDTREVTNAYGGEVQWDTRTASETRTFLRAGAQQVELETGDSETAWLAGAGVNFLIGRNELFADIGRNVGPSSVGTVVTRDQLRLRWTRAVTPRFSLLAGVRGTRDEGVDPASTFEERRYATGDVGVQWRWQEEFSLRVAYDYTWQEYTAVAQDATSSGALVSVLYQPLQRRR